MKDNSKLKKNNEEPVNFTDNSNKKVKNKKYLKLIINKIKNRHFILSFGFLIFAFLILLNTIILQLSYENISGVESSTGISRERIIKAPRGNIYDRYGVPLAITEEINVLYLANANLDNNMLNAVLLDIANYLEENDIEYINSLSNYLTINPVQFEKELWEIISWQSNRHIFNLKETHTDEIVKYSDKKFVKTDPLEFFNYLRYTLFNLDPSYSVEESYKIIRLRYEIFVDSWNFRNGKLIELARDVDYDTISYLEEQNFRFIGIVSGQEYERRYMPDAKYLAHVIGYMGAISSLQFRELQSAGYFIDDSIGQSGVEFTAERYLRGTNGIRPYNIFIHDNQRNVYYSEDFGKPPLEGNNVLLTIDLDLQKVAMKSLEENIEFIKNNPRDKNKGDADSGAVVMIDVRTGEVLVMASFPSYNPTDFIMAKYDKESEKNMVDALTNIKDKPMLNRTTMEIYAPGSTFKPMTAIAAIESGVSTNIRCNGTEMIGEWQFSCLQYPRGGHGDLDLSRALATSCNIYFHKMGVNTGINNMDKWMKLFGLGEFTGIDLPGEEKGFRSNRENKMLLRQDPSDQIWFPADTAQSAIGQFDNKYTILQLAIYTAAIATGELVQPHVIKEISGSSGIVLNSGRFENTPIPVNKSTLEQVTKGMLQATNSGIVRNTFSGFPFTVASKTGTAETGHEDKSSSNALFICFAPVENPEIAIAQIVEKGVWGSNTISIAHDLLSEYFGVNRDFEYETVVIPILD